MTTSSVNDPVGVTFTIQALAPGGLPVSHVQLYRELPPGTLLYSQTPAAVPGGAVPEGWMLFPKAAWDFLCGAGELNGFSFGERPAAAPNFWWRSIIRKMLGDAPQPAEQPLAKNQPCGCVVCTCEDERQCQGCGARHCGAHPVGEIPNPAHVRPTAPPAQGESIEKRVSDLRTDLDRNHLLNEAACRADYFFRQLDGSYSFPSCGGQVSQIIEMLLAAANVPAVQGEPVGEVRFEFGIPSSVYAELYSETVPSLKPGTKLYTAPQPTPDVSALVEALESELATVKKVAYGSVALLDEKERLQAECDQMRKDAATGRQIDRAAQHLPEGWSITVEVEKDAGWVDVCDPSGASLVIDLIGSLAEQIEQAIDAAMAGGG